MSRQNQTRKITEGWVKQQLENLGLEVFGPDPYPGVDFVVSFKKKSIKKLNVQVKGRGKEQTNKKYRWFQIRTTPKQRKDTIKEGLPLCEAWRKKVAMADIFIFVSEKYREFWILEPKLAPEPVPSTKT